MAVAWISALALIRRQPLSKTLCQQSLLWPPPVLCSYTNRPPASCTILSCLPRRLQRCRQTRFCASAYFRRAYELAFATCYMFAGVRPVFLEVDEVTFQSPVGFQPLCFPM